VSWDAIIGATSYNLYYKAGTTVDMTSGTKLTGVTSPKQVTGLINGTQYAFAVSSVNAGGESGLSSVVMATPNIVDIDGNIYHTVTIGTQVWMVENLKTTRYNDGSPIPLVTDSAAWANFTTPGYCWYNDSATYGSIYGALYNWYAVNMGKLAPTGWHIPSYSEWTVLFVYLGDTLVAGGPLKDTTNWFSPNTGATNSTGFSALPGGFRNYDGTFHNIGYNGFWWSSSPSDSTNSVYFGMSDYYVNVFGFSSYNVYGLSVRCVKDN
jgi:Fibronectin type III domain./Fibrobacter succinogenes major domain (Fib_succ_major).